MNALIHGIVAGSLTVPFLAHMVRLFRVEVAEGESVLVTRFGKLVATLSEPGWRWLPSRILPWVGLRRVSRRSAFRQITDIYVNDARGTTVVADVWLEFRIVDAARAVFEVEDWDESLRNVVSHAVIAILGNREFKEILCDRNSIAADLRREIAAETSRWGIEIELAFIRKVSLLPEVTEQVHQTIAARLQRAQADVEEDGRVRVALLEAETSAETAVLLAQARGQYPAAVGRALAEIGRAPEVLRAYEELYDLSQLRPHRTVAFSGFGEGNGGLTASDAAMLADMQQPVPAGDARRER